MRELQQSQPKLENQSHPVLTAIHDTGILVYLLGVLILLLYSLQLAMGSIKACFVQVSQARHYLT